MICGNLYSFRTVRSLVLGAVATGLAASTSSPARAANSGTWADTGSMSVARVGHTATLLRNGQVLVAGGENSTNGLSSAELYNPATP
jgi:N-acetylneuraminic acid mutarotase